MGAIRMLLPVLLLAGLVACTPAQSEEPAFGSDLEVIAADDGVPPHVRFEAGDTRPQITVVDAEGAGLAITAPAGVSEVPLLGLRADTSYTVVVEADGRRAAATVTTAALPDDLPPIEVTSRPSDMAPGLTLFDAIPLRPEDDGGVHDDGYLLAVDENGEVVWLFRQEHSIQDVRLTGDGHLLYIHHETGARKLDPATGTFVEWSGVTGLEGAPQDRHGRRYAGDGAIRVETDQMHHEVLELANGNLMTLSRESRRVDGFPEGMCDDETGTSHDVVADTVVEFEAGSGAVVAEWSLFDMADPLADLDRIRPAEFCSRYLLPVYPDGAARDWTHANAVVLDAARNAVLVSVRHLDQVFAVRYRDDASGPAGELLWRLGENGDFELTAGEWFLHQHAPQVLADGSIMIYDNGNERPGTSLDDPDRLPYSRAVRYELDTESMTATQVWEHRLDEPGRAVYAPFVGDADLLDGGTVLITHGGQLDPPAHSPREEGSVAWGQIVEVDYDTGEVVFDLRLRDPADQLGWIIYRAERISTLYPPDYTVRKIG